MKFWGCALVTLGLATLLAAGTTQADVVKVSLGLTLNGSSTACGGPCIETLSGSLLWNTTTESLIPGSASIGITGPLSFVTFRVLGGSTNTDLQVEFSDAGGDFMTIGFDLGSGSPVLGSYIGIPNGQTPAPGDFFLVGSGCMTSLCNTDFPSAVDTITGATGSVSATPEPGTAGMLLAGLLCAGGLGWCRKLLA